MQHALTIDPPPCPGLARDEASIDEPRRRIGELMRAHGAYLHGLARRLCRHQLDAEDLVQDVLVKLVQSPHAIPDGANERAWLSRVVHNQFIDRVRRRAVRAEASIADEPPAVPPEEHAWWEGLTADDVRAQLVHLPAALRQTFELFAFEHRSYDDIAAQLAIAKATVGTRILRARTRLRELLAHERARAVARSPRAGSRRPDRHRAGGDLVGTTAPKDAARHRG